MCCQKCEDQHEGHNKAYFKDQYIYDCENFDNVEHISSKEIQKIASIHSSGDLFLLKGAQTANSQIDASGRSPKQNKILDSHNGSNKLEDESFTTTDISEKSF
jgi:hypothetical protein